MKLLKDRKPGFWLAAAAAVIAIVGAAAYLIVYAGTADPTTGEWDRVFKWLCFALMLGGGLIGCAGEALRLRIGPVLAGACYAVALGIHLVETAYPLADVLTKVPFFGGDPTIAIAFSVVFALAAILNVVSAFMEHNKKA
ncbi:MAG: hypothetical protein IJK35_01700 [Oscillospiraceae bacterium]|nr:hypothetical protein [Oscillospiraceae bacterium]